MSVPQNGPRLKLDTLANRPSPSALPDGDLFVATDVPGLAVSASKQWRDLLQGGQAQLGAPFALGTSTIGPAAGLSLRLTSVIGLTRRADVLPSVPPFGMLVVTIVTLGGPNAASFEVSSITAAGALVPTDVGHFDWSIVG
jgi:hypothetical protein